MPRATMSEPFRLGLHFQPIVRFIISTAAQRSNLYLAILIISTSVTLALAVGKHSTACHSECSAA